MVTQMKISIFDMELIPKCMVLARLFFKEKVLFLVVQQINDRLVNKIRTLVAFSSKQTVVGMLVVTAYQLEAVETTG